MKMLSMMTAFGGTAVLRKKREDEDERIYLRKNLNSFLQTLFYVATMFDAKIGKIESYVKSGRLKKVKI